MTTSSARCRCGLWTSILLSLLSLSLLDPTGATRAPPHHRPTKLELPIFRNMTTCWDCPCCRALQHRTQHRTIAARSSSTIRTRPATTGLGTAAAVFTAEATQSHVACEGGLRLRSFEFGDCWDFNTLDLELGCRRGSSITALDRSEI